MCRRRVSVGVKPWTIPRDPSPSSTLQLVKMSEREEGRARKLRRHRPPFVSSTAPQWMEDGTKTEFGVLRSSSCCSIFGVPSHPRQGP